MKVVVTPDWLVIAANTVVAEPAFPPNAYGVKFKVVEPALTAASAITPLPAVGSSPTLRVESLLLDASSVYSLNHPAVDSPTFIT